MARKESITKDLILKKGAVFIKEQGIHNLNARNLAKYIGCSTQPIFRNFINMEDFKKQLKVELKKGYNTFIDEIVNKEDYLLTISYAYALYAKKEPNIFSALFISDLAGTRTIDEVINSSWNRDTIIAMTKQYNISLKKAESIYRDTRFYTHGISTQICCNSISISDNEIKELINNIIEKLLKE